MKKSNVGGTKNDFTARSKEVVLGDAGCASAPLNKLHFETWRRLRQHAAYRGQCFREEECWPQADAEEGVSG